MIFKVLAWYKDKFMKFQLAKENFGIIKSHIYSPLSTRLSQYISQNVHGIYAKAHLPILWKCCQLYSAYAYLYNLHCVQVFLHIIKQTQHTAYTNLN